MRPIERPLHGRVAVVTGASRGAGRGIAVELGAAGATVYVTGRSTRERPAGSYARLLALSQLPAMPGTIEDTAEGVAREGGRGIPVRCDHTDAEDVAGLLARLEREEDAWTSWSTTPGAGTRRSRESSTRRSGSSRSTSGRR